VRVPFFARTSFLNLSEPLAQALGTCAPAPSLRMKAVARSAAPNVNPSGLNVELEVEPPRHIILHSDAVQVGECRPLLLHNVGGKTVETETDETSDPPALPPNPIAEEDIIQRMLLHRPPKGFGAMSTREARVSVVIKSASLAGDEGGDRVYHGPLHRLVQ
jgi:hypothetical protein